jgi:hypothetical protein
VINQDLDTLKPDVLAVQEDWFDSPVDQFPGYTLKAKCQAERQGARYLANSIYVRDDHDLAGLASDPDTLDITGGCRSIRGLVPRCAALLTVKGVRIANLHACGGQFDDPEFRHMAALKTKEKHVELVAQKKPDLIVGDFNAENDRGAAERGLRDYRLYQRLTDKDKALFLDFFLGHVEPLKRLGFLPAYDSRAEGTSAYRTTVDWMYYKPSALEPVGEPLVVETIAKKYTDHNGVMVTFRVVRP